MAHVDITYRWFCCVTIDTAARRNRLTDLFVWFQILLPREPYWLYGEEEDVSRNETEGKSSAEPE